MCRVVSFQLPGDAAFLHSRQWSFINKIVLNSTKAETIQFHCQNKNPIHISLAGNWWVTMLAYLFLDHSKWDGIKQPSNFVLNSQLLESPTAEVLTAKLHQEFCIHERQQGGHFQRKPQSDEPGVTVVPHTQTLQHTKYIQEIWARLIHVLQGNKYWRFNISNHLEYHFVKTETWYKYMYNNPSNLLSNINNYG